MTTLVGGGDEDMVNGDDDRKKKSLQSVKIQNYVITTVSSFINVFQKRIAFSPKPI
jgi:hypothetical protein